MKKAILELSDTQLVLLYIAVIYGDHPNKFTLERPIFRILKECCRVYKEYTGLSLDGLGEGITKKLRKELQESLNSLLTLKVKERYYLNGLVAGIFKYSLGL